MPKKKKESVNYLDQIPRISVPKWEVLEDGLVEVTVENKGFFNVIAQKCFHRPRTSYIKLDEYGSCEMCIRDRSMIVQRRKIFLIHSI